MIEFYSGTPGSGKSLHVAERLFFWICRGLPCICNFDIATDKIPGRKKDFHFVTNDKLTPKYLIQFANAHNANKGRIKEDSILLVIDECQLLFNARDYGRPDRRDWLSFFTLHRHLGYRIILVAQFDRMIDRQVRALIEYEYVHRKVSNMGWKGKLLSVWTFNKLFVCVKQWYPMKERIGAEFFIAKRIFYRLYDTYGLFTVTDGADGGKGDPSRQPKTEKGRVPSAVEPSGLSADDSVTDASPCASPDASTGCIT